VRTFSTTGPVTREVPSQRALTSPWTYLRYGWWSLGTSLFAPGDPFGVGAGFEVSF
jgi:hypothetical protein